MGRLLHLQVKIPRPMFEALTFLVEQGKYQNISDAVRIAICDLIRREYALEQQAIPKK